MHHAITRLLLCLYFLPAIAAADLGDGCAITIIQPGSAADKAGVHLGDVLMEADGKSIGTMSDLHIAVTPVEGSFVMMVQRGEKLMKLKADVHSMPEQPKLGIRCVPMKEDAVGVSTRSPSRAEIGLDELPKLVPTPSPPPPSPPIAPTSPIPVASPLAVSESKRAPIPSGDTAADSSLLDASTSPLDCPFPIPMHATAKLTLKDGHIVEGKLVSCDPQNVTLHSGLLSGTFSAGRVLKIELIP